MTKINNDYLYVCKDQSSEIQSLRSQNKMLSDQLEGFRGSFDDLEQHSRNENLLIHGIPLPLDNTLETDVCALVVDVINNNLPNIRLLPEDISIAHRTGGPKTNSARTTQGATQGPTQGPTSNRARPPPIVVRFARRQLRNQILSLRRHLKGKNLSLTEQLTPLRASLLKKAYELVTEQKVDSAWSHDGHILVKTKLNRIIQVRSIVDLIQFSA